ncbi:MAG: aminodeoxychorismate/anthranilate synthase component II [Flavobacteriales bacterium]|nr:aminodeoxychorismate/anthranilate synthase component II [Flavobacteriales bacterium]
MSTLILDNYDSFTYNLVHLVEQVEEDFEVHRNDKILLKDVGKFDNIIISPGPGLPSESGILMDILKQYHSQKKILGVCLGLQAIVEFFGGKLFNMPEVRHGIEIENQIVKETDIFTGIPKTHIVGLYHSWAAEEKHLPETLEITSRSNENIIMSVRHKSLPIYGVQYHPESVMSEYGIQLIDNWLKI